MSGRRSGRKSRGTAGKPAGKLVRVDDLLAVRGLFASRDEAMRACFAGEVSSPDAAIASPSQLVPVNIEVNVKRHSRFVSRGGDKLEGALEDFGFDPSGMSCIDAGASSGGFTDCLLQHGAARVAAVDVAHSQLDWKLRNDPRVAVFDRTNIRCASAEELGGPFDLLVADLSFISLEELLPSFRNLTDDAGYVLLMVKPQFEAGRESVEEGGVVRKASEHIKVLENMLAAMSRNGFEPLMLAASKVPGKKKGNMEFFVLAGIDGCSSIRPECLKELPGKGNASIDVGEIVAAAHERFGV